MKEDGSPFFWVGDTAWELFHKLNREEAELYLITRAQQGFNVIQAVALAENDGLTTGNGYGRLLLKKNEKGLYDPCLPDTDGEYSYWDHMDYIVKRAVISYHPWGETSSSLYLHEEEWLDFNMIQSGHARRSNHDYSLIQKDYGREPVKPTLEGQPCYEDHPIAFKEDNEFFDQVDVRKALYWSVFAGACGVTYGHHCVWVHEY